MTVELLIDLAGWVGVAALLLAYWMVSTKRTQGDSWFYQLANIAGSLLLILNSFYYRALPSVGVNIAWIGIAGITLFRRWNRSLKDRQAIDEHAR